MADSITCPKCGTISHHPHDIAEGYCGNCHAWTSPRVDSPPRRGERRAGRFGRDIDRVLHEWMTARVLYPNEYNKTFGEFLIERLGLSLEVDSYAVPDSTRSRWVTAWETP